MKKIFIAGHNGMVGSHILNILKKYDLITVNKTKLDLLNQHEVFNFLNKKKPDEVYICAARVGGIVANNQNPASFIYENLLISANLIHGCYINGIKKIMYLGSSCIYPKYSKIPIKEEYLLNGPLEKTNEAYSIAKIAGLKMCQYYNKQYSNSNLDFRAVMPCNLYGENDNFDPINGHVIPSLIHKFHNAKIKQKKKIDLWGDGTPKREFLHVRDFADACVYLMNLSKRKFYKKGNDYQHINVGSGSEITINKLSNIIKKIVGFKGKVFFDKKNPNGTHRKLLDISYLRSLKWKPKIKLETGLQEVYKYYLAKYNET